MFSRSTRVDTSSTSFDSPPPVAVLRNVSFNLPNSLVGLSHLESRGERPVPNTDNLQSERRPSLYHYSNCDSPVRFHWQESHDGLVGGVDTRAYGSHRICEGTSSTKTRLTIVCRYFHRTKNLSPTVLGPGSLSSRNFQPQHPLCITVSNTFKVDMANW